jgi:hypothetical protein
MSSKSPGQKRKQLDVKVLMLDDKEMVYHIQVVILYVRILINI